MNMWAASSTNPPVVVCKTDSSDPVRFAKAEMERYLGEILGCKVENTSVPVIELSVDSRSGLSDEGFEFRIDGDTLRITGGGDLGVVFGVYAFLREVCGCQFSGLGRDSEFVPRKDRIEATFDVVRHEPKLWYRGVQFSVIESPELYRQRIDWMAKNGLNYVMLMLATEETGTVKRTEIDPRTGEPILDGTKRNPRITESWFNQYLLPEIQKRGLKLDVNHHNLRFWLPPEKYLQAHPDWYAETNGERGKMHNQLFICTSNEDAVQTLVANVLAYLRTHPDVKIVGVIPEDGNGMCQCAKCVAGDAWPEDAFRPVLDNRTDEGENRSLAVRYAKLINRVARAVRAERPDVLIGYAAYVDLQWPPRGVELESNVVAWVAIYWRDGARVLAPSGTSPYNVFYFDLLRKWKAAFKGRLILYEYYMGMNAQRSLPYPMGRVICREWPALKGLGVEGATVQCLVTCQQAYALNLLAFARCGWEERVDADALLDDFLLGMYGSVAKDVLPIYRGILDALDQLAAVKPGDPAAGPPEIPDAVLQPKGDNVGYFLRVVGRETIERSLAAATKNATNDRERRQVGRLSQYLRYCELAAKAVPGEVIEYLRTMPNEGWFASSAVSRWETVRHKLERHS